MVRTTEVSVNDRRILPEFGEQARCKGAPESHNNDVITHLIDHVEVVFDDQKGNSGAAEFADVFDKALYESRIYACHWFVQQ